MKPTRVALAVLVAFAVLVAAACGGSDESVPSNAVAVVDGTPVTKAELDALLTRAKKSYTSQKRAFPKAGTAEYQSLQTQAVAFLVQRAEYNKQADQLKIAVTDKEVENRIAQVKKQYFAGSQAKLEKQLKEQGYTTESFRADIEAQLLSEKIYDDVTKDVKVTDAQIAKYYAENKSQYQVAESRDVRHILVKTKAEADKIYDEIKAGGDFGALAKKYSLDTGSKAAGGKLTITRGQTVAAFDTTAFLMSTNQVSHPIKTEFGYHVIQPISDVKPAKTTPLKDVQAQIKAQLLEKGKNDAISTWTTETKKAFDDEGRLRDWIRAAGSSNRHGDDHRLTPVPLAEALLELQELTKRLRRDCPWDREQTARTIVSHTVEEAYEVADAANAGDNPKLLDELGDLLFQTYFLALLLDEQGVGDLETVARTVHAKLIRRHPHVFADADADSAGRVRERWEAIKTEQEGRTGVFHDVPDALPGLLQARKVQRRAAAVGFDWPDLDGPLAKVREELAETEAELARVGRPAPETEPDPRIFAELGDLLFTVVNLARVVNVDPELALRATSKRFVERVELAESLAAHERETWADLELDAQEAWYLRAKAQLDRAG